MNIMIIKLVLIIVWSLTTEIVSYCYNKKNYCFDNVKYNLIIITA